jgi:hypothetical protein
MTRKTFKITLLTFALATNLFFSPCYVLKSALAEGVTIDFQNLLNLLSVELPPNTNIPSISPTSPESAGPAQLSAFDKNLRTNANPVNMLNIPEPTDELFRPLNFGPLIGDEPLLPEAEPYTVTVCLIYNEIPAAGCSETSTPEQAAEKLASFILNKSLRDVIDRPFRIVMPSSMPSDQQIQLLCKIETEAIGLIEAKLSKEGREQKPFITEEAEKARKDAESGIHWSHNWQEDKASHQFHAQKAFGQLNSTAISER